MSMAKAPKVLTVDDEPEICWIIKKVLGEKGFDVHTSFDGERGLEMAKAINPDVVLLDLKLPGMSGLETLRLLKESLKKIPVIILSAFDDITAAVRAMKLGAYDYISKPLNLDEMFITLENALKVNQLMREVEDLRSRIDEGRHTPLIWSCPEMKRVMETVERIAPYDVTVMIRGESGTGKELIAEYLHAHSPREKKPLVSIDCGALPETLVESELFGYEKGAFTGATVSKPGRFEMANGGTLFLDEIGNLPMATQMKFLRVLQTRRLQRLGGKKEMEIDVRVVTATNSDLQVGMRAGQFREDLFHRLNEFNITLPPLRERGEEILLLANHFLARFCRQFNKTCSGFSEAVLECLRNHAWPGNVRELMNTVKRAVVLSTGRLELEHLPAEMTAPRKAALVPAATGELSAEVMPLREIREKAARRIEKDTIVRALEDTHWNKVKAARRLQINYKTLFNKIRELGI